MWRTDDRGANWRSLGDSLPTQAVGSIAYAGGTLVIVTGDNVFGGGGTFAGLGAFRSTDGGATWQKATGVPSGVIAFKVAADPNNASIFYAATGAGLYRSTDGGASFVNVKLPTGACAGQAPVSPCALANMVTDVVVQGPDNAATDGTPGAVLAAVGWRAGRKTSQYGYVEAPGNGVYRSDAGAPGTFTAAGAFAPTTNPGRIELAAATGAEQDRQYVYAMVADAAKFNGDPPLDARSTSVRRIRRTSAACTCPRTWEELVADGVSGADSRRRQLPLGADQRRVRDPVLPGIQSWQNQWIAADPTGTRVPKRLVFGLEEIWRANPRPGSRVPRASRSSGRTSRAARACS